MMPISRGKLIPKALKKGRAEMTTKQFQGKKKEKSVDERIAGASTNNSR